ncbi:ribonuclease P protein component [Roseateles sp.]|uniref:ribonuclease P protein component n=1 Tax=Roseateles sp. TaxID=1971397 RepID=UPI0031D5E640
MIGRILRSADFERVLGTPSRARSAHFAVHHLAVSPSLPKRRPSGAANLSTGDAPIHPQAVDESRDPTDAAASSAALSIPDDASHRAVATPVAPIAEIAAAPQGAWLGYVVPKRHAKRAVTRALLKRQIRAIFGDLGELPPGLWVVRLRNPFDRKQFPSASSDALRAAARAELQQLTRKLARPPAGG